MTSWPAGGRCFRPPIITTKRPLAVFAFLLREADGRITTETDRHVTSRIDPWHRDVFIARKLP